MPRLSLQRCPPSNTTEASGKVGTELSGLNIIDGFSKDIGKLHLDVLLFLSDAGELILLAVFIVGNGDLLTLLGGGRLRLLARSLLLTLSSGNDSLGLALGGARGLGSGSRGGTGS
jgi:hypothetical protein